MRLTANLLLALSALLAFASAEYDILWLVNGAYYPLIPVTNGTADRVVFTYIPGQSSPKYKSYRKHRYWGINVTVTANENNVAPGVYGIETASLGHDGGATVPVYGVLNGKSRRWVINDGVITNRPTSSVDGLYACKDEANGKAGVFLRHGLPKGAKHRHPQQCVETVLKQIFNEGNGQPP